MEISPFYPMQPIPYFGEKLKGEWIVEPKIDGWRLIILKQKNGKIEYWGRRLEKNPNWTEKLSYLNKSLKNLPKGSALDCELYSSIGRRGISSVLAKTKRAKPLIFVFDIVYYKNKFIGKNSLKERKKILKRIKLLPPFVVLKYQKLKDIKEALRMAASSGYEGIVIKNLNSKYQIGREGPIATLDWRKIKI